ncbi:MAG TPA: hypothetical protein VE129_01520 [Thermoanaerobaculia bacterium]|nr:hypothetical protein [Thermoanaerobaculia bacterium]
MTYWEAGPPPDADDLETVGLTLRPEANGGFTVAGTTMGAVGEALRGTPGATRQPVVESEGKRRTVDATVVRFP